MTNYDEPITISNGMDVYGADDEKVGSVADMRGDYVVVSKGFFFPTDYFIPTSAISSVSGNSIYLNVTKDAALSQGWDVEPEYSTVGNDVIVDAGLQVQNPVGTATDERWDEARATAIDPVDESAWVATDVTETAHRADDSTVLEDDVLRVPLAEEELTATKRDVERGNIHVEKVVTTEDATLEVPVSEEEVKVTRRIVDRSTDAGDRTFEELTIDMPVRGEVVDVAKETHVREEIEIAKERRTGTERITDTVRREDVRVTDDTGDVVDDGEWIDNQNINR